MTATNMAVLPRTLDIQQGAALGSFKKKTIIVLSGIMLSIFLYTAVSKFVSVFVLDNDPDEDNVVTTVN